MLKTFNKERLLLGAAFLGSLIVSFLLEGWVRKCGFLLTPDSHEYLSAAKTFKTSGMFIGTAGNYYTQWPPLFPLILSLFDDPLNAMAYVQFICKVIIGLVTLFLANQFLSNVIVKIIFLLGVWLSVHMLMISVFLWSEIIFMTLYMIHLYVSLNLGKKAVYYYLMILFGIFLCLQRNAGLFLVCSTAVWMLVDNSLVIDKKYFKAVVYIALCTLSLFCWYYYNIIFMPGSKPYYEREFFAHTLMNIEMILSALSHAFFPFRGSVAVVTGLVIFGVFATGCYQYFRISGAVMLLVLSIAIYTLGFLPVPNLDIHEMERYFTIILPVFLVLMLLFIERLTAKSSTWLTIAVLCLSLWVTYCVVRTGKNALQWHEMSCNRVSNK